MGLAAWPACLIPKAVDPVSHPPLTIYLDNAATTFPKPPEVIGEMLETYARLGVSPGRGGYDLAIQAQDLVNEVRRQTSEFFGGDGPERVIFSYNATDALNTLIFGLVEPGCHVVSSRLEHNSVLRPLNHLRQQGVVTVDLVPFNSLGFIEPQNVAAAISSKTKLVILTHASNVLGTIQPVDRVAEICRDRGVPLVLDVSQSAGLIPVNMKARHVDALAFTGHKSLFGPTGIGGIVLRRGLEVQPSRFGGTGVDSRNVTHVQEYPLRLEPGTINLLGIIGLAAGMRYIARLGQENIHHREMALVRRLRDGLASLDRVRLYCSENLDHHLPLLTCNVEGILAEDLSSILDGDFNIAARAGLHCAPLVHEDLGTSPAGGVRFSLGPFNGSEDIDAVLEAFRMIVTHQ